MLRRTISWSLIILSALVLYLFSNESVTLALLIAVIIALPVSFAVLRLTGSQLEVSIRDAEKDPDDPDRKRFELCMRNNGILPIAAADIEVKCTNLRTGETDMYTVSKSIPPKRVRKTGLEVVPAHAGRYELSVTSARMTDPLGIWKKDVSCSDSRAMTVMPEVFDMHMIPAGAASMPESERDSALSKGAVAGDMTGIREYVPGDPVRNIHWKLSEKTDKILVKELGNPLTDQFLIILDSSVEIAQDPAALDAAAAVYASLISGLVELNMSVTASWTDPYTGRAVIRRIASSEDALAAADEYLAVPAMMPSAFRNIERNVADSRYAHIVIVGSRIPVNVENISNGSQVTVLMYGGTTSFNDKNLTVIGFEAGSYAADTAGIEV